jgi:hypothetical protein
MVAQAWNIYSFAVPVVRQFFGVEPLASEKTVTINPLMPSEWDGAKLENIKIAENELDITYSKKDGKLRWEIHQKDPDWNLILKIPKSTVSNFKLLEASVPVEETDKDFIFHTSGDKLIIEGNYSD